MEFYSLHTFYPLCPSLNFVVYTVHVLYTVHRTFGDFILSSIHFIRFCPLHTFCPTYTAFHTIFIDFIFPIKLFIEYCTLYYSCLCILHRIFDDFILPSIDIIVLRRLNNFLPTIHFMQYFPLYSCCPPYNGAP